MAILRRHTSTFFKPQKNYPADFRAIFVVFILMEVNMNGVSCDSWHDSWGVS